MQALEDLIVQTEIFLQYSLQAKALERLQKIAAMFPGEEERHPRLRVSFGEEMERSSWPTIPSSAFGAVKLWLWPLAMQCPRSTTRAISPRPAV